MHSRIIHETVLFFKLDRIEDFVDFLGIQKSDQLPLAAFLWNGKDSIRLPLLFRRDKTDHSGKGFQDSQSLISGFGCVGTIGFQLVEKIQNQIRCQMFKFQGLYFYLVVPGGKR